MDWDISFCPLTYNVNILANNGALVELYTYPDGDISDWETLSIANIGSWSQMYNSIDDWYDGAFMQNYNGEANDYGWRVYNMENNHILGDSLFVIKTTAGNYKKLWIVEKNPEEGINEWIFKYADIDGSSLQEITIQADDYSSVNHIAFSLETNQIIETEPPSNEWDLLFTKYYDKSIPFYVPGILSNSVRVSVQEVDGVDQATYEDYDDTQGTSLFSYLISTIGSDWKSYMTKDWELDDDRVFFVKVTNETATDSTYWKMYFTGFTGMSEGIYDFEQEMLLTTNIGSLNNSAIFEVYPNPATDNINIVYDTKEAFQIKIIDMLGRTVYTNNINKIGFTNQQIDISNFEKGIYTIIIQTETIRNIQKFFKN